MDPSRSGHRTGPYFTIDLHTHTTRGSADSNLAPRELIERAQAIRLDAICITEHDNTWDLKELVSIAAIHGVVCLRGIEVTTELGHVGVFGLDEYVGGIYKLDPRFSFINSDHQTIDIEHPERAARLEIIEACDAIEVLNAACSEEENLFALKVARALNKAEVGGSDSHSANSVGVATTLFPSRVSSVDDLVAAIRARATRAGRGLLDGCVKPFDLP